MKWLQAVALLFVALFALGAVNHQTAKTRVVVRTERPAQTIYIRNLAPKFHHRPGDHECDPGVAARRQR